MTYYQAFVSTLEFSPMSSSNSNVNESQGNGTAFVVKTWMIVVILFLAGHLGASLWWGATLTANQVNLSEKVDSLATKLETSAGSRYTADDARLDKELILELHRSQGEKLAAQQSRLNELTAMVGRIRRE